MILRQYQISVTASHFMELWRFTRAGAVRSAMLVASGKQ